MSTRVLEVGHLNTEITFDRYTTRPTAAAAVIVVRTFVCMCVQIIKTVYTRAD